MKTYIALIKHKIHWLHLTAAILVLGVFTSVALQQYAAQQFYGGSRVSALPFHEKSAIKHPATAPQSVTQPATTPAVANKPVTSAGSATSAPTTPKTAAATASSKTKAATPTQPTATPTTPGATPTPPVTSGSDIASEATCPGQSSTANVAVVLACMTAYARAQHGIGSISNNAALVAAAVAKAQDMNSCGYSHTACGRPFNYWFSVKGFVGNCSAENIAAGQQSTGEVFTAWMNSAGHRANILNGSYSAIGAAVTASSSGNLWVMELGGC